MITKGAVSNVLDVCSSVELTSGCHNIAFSRDEIERQCKSLGNDGGTDHSGHADLETILYKLAERSLVVSNDHRAPHYTGITL